MARLISRFFINDLLSRTNIINLIDVRIKLKKIGKNFYACCPFHNENTPSFSVSSYKQFYYCFGCGAHGNAIDFLMHFDGLNFIESIEELSAFNGIKTIYENNIKFNNNTYFQRKDLYDLMDKLSNFYEKSLKDKKGIIARQYLKNRGLNESLITLFSIGYALPEWNSVIKFFGGSLERQTLLNNSGVILVNKENKKIYDRFRDRIIFPIKNKTGQVVAFGGRSLNNNQPKYLNSSETLIFHKKRQLYGLYEATKKYFKVSQLLIVEGYMDVLMLTQFGINYAVATLGTTTTADHIQLLYRSTDCIICCYDGDTAGRNAAWRALKTSLPYLHDGRQIRFMFLPDKEDPDTLIRKIGKAAFEKYMRLSKPMPVFLFETLINQVDLKSINGRIKLSLLALPLIKKVSGNILRLYLRQQLGNKLGIIDDNKLEQLLPKKIININKFPKKNIKKTIIHILIGLLIQNPRLHIFALSIKDIKYKSNPSIELFHELIQVCKSYPNLTTGALLERYRDNKFYYYLSNLAIWNHMIIDEQVEATFIDTLVKFNSFIIENIQESLIAKERIYGLTDKERKELWSLLLDIRKNKNKI